MNSYFAPSEFRGWFTRLNPNLLINLNLFRELWHNPVLVSPAKGAIGRNNGIWDKSQHNFDYWQMVNATDVMPLISENGKTRGCTLDEIKKAYQIARVSNLFSGIGIYPDWKPYRGLHLDVRADRTPANPALWAGVKRGNKQVYVEVGQVV